MGLSSSLVVLLVLPFDLIDLELDALVGFLRGDRGDLLDLALFFFVLLLPLADESSENLVKPVGIDDAAKRRSLYSTVGEEPGNGALLSWRGGMLFMVTW